jgi:hypothetical protein
MSPLAQDIYRVLREQVPAADGRIPYDQMIFALNPVHQIETPYDARLSFACSEIVSACRESGQPVITALLVETDRQGSLTYPGPGYYSIAHPEAGHDQRRRLTAWGEEWQQVRTTQYPEYLDQQL